MRGFIINTMYVTMLLLGWRLVRLLVPAALFFSLPRSWTSKILGSVFALPYLGSLSLAEVMVFAAVVGISYLSSDMDSPYGVAFTMLKAFMFTSIWRYLVVPILHA
jgi:hypothetical protein